MNKRLHILLVFVWCLLTASAQNISVASFRMLENDLTANTHGTMERDQNGEVAALIKIVTSEQGFTFDGGMVGITKVKQEVGEVWVYVPHGLKKITIKHQQLGVLRDYFFPLPIEKARTYEMVLTTGRVETVVTHAVSKQYVIFNVTPANASVELGDEVLTVDEIGSAAKNVPFGTYSYRVSCANYHTAAGQVTVTAEGKAEVNVTLRPNFGWMKLDASSDEYRGAYVYVNNERVGQLPYMSKELKSGSYKVKVVKSMYKPFEAQVLVSDNETATIDVSLVPNFANITLVADAESEIWIDGEKKGVGRWVGPLEMGDYTVEVRKPSHRNASEIVHVATPLAKTINLKSPSPIYATLELESNPLRARVLVDGVEVGETPLMKGDVLIGTHKVTFQKEGYTTVEKTVVVKENEENHLSATLVSKSGAGMNVVGNKTPVAPATSGKDKKKEEQKEDQKKEAKKADEGQEKNQDEEQKAKPSSIIIGAGAGYSTYGFNYGGEVGFALHGFTVSVGVKNNIMGKYTMCDNLTGAAEEEHSVQLLRFNAKVGYTLGENFQFTPQVGVVFGTSFLTGKEYVMGELPVWDGVDSKKQMVLADKDYRDMNKRIMKMAEKSFRLSLGARMGYTTNSGLGVYVTPEYVIGEGVAVSAGLSFKF